MSPSVTWTPESEEWPIGRGWRYYWRERQRDQSKRALRYISREKHEVRRRMHRKTRRSVRRELREFFYHDKQGECRN